jgi:hypothetical protein
MKLILNSIKYRGRSRTLDFTINPDIVIPGNIELKNMNYEKKQFGSALR